jgi:3-phosphoshikimate 1-carboxyvinyltransferase
LLSDDTLATVRALRDLGIAVELSGNSAALSGTLAPPGRPLRVQDSGTTLRLLTAVACLLDDDVRFEAGVSLRRRPMGPLLAALESLGAATDSRRGRAPLRVRGPLRGGRATLPAGISSQFVSALLLACPVAAGDSTIHLRGPGVSQPYVDMTLALLRAHGGRVTQRRRAFHIRGRQSLRPRQDRIPGDFSSAAFFMVAAAISGGKVRLDNLQANDTQGDRAIVPLMGRFGADVRSRSTSVTVESRPLRGQAVNIGAFPDLFPPLCVLAACARGTTVLDGAPHLRAKESDRIRAMAVNLRRAQIRVRELPGGLRIEGGHPRGVPIRSFGDHRVAMAMSVLALAAKGPSRLPDPTTVAKSNPRFFDDLARLTAGGARA